MSIVRTCRFSPLLLGLLTVVIQVFAGSTRAGGSAVGGEELPVVNQPPEVRLALPERATWYTPGWVPLIALAHDADGYVATVEFFAGPKTLGVVTNGCPFCENFPHEFDLNWTNPPVGVHEITAWAVDDQGAATRSEPTTVTVVPEADPPPKGASVVMVRPADGSFFDERADILIEVDTYDPADHFPLVEFFADGRKVGESRLVFIREPDPGTRILHSWTWTRPPLGVHTLTVWGTTGQGKSLAGRSPVTIISGRPLNLELQIRVDRVGRAHFVLPEGSMAGYGFDLWEGVDLKTWRRLGPFLPGDVAAFFDLELDASDERSKFYRAQSAAP